jgi:hypothetical protein
MFRAALATITQSAVVPEHAPPHPTNVCPDAGAALRVTIVPSGNVWLQLVGPTHCRPLGLKVTVPEPPMEITKAAVCADDVDVGLDVPLAPFEEPPPPHATRKLTIAHAPPKRRTDISFTTHHPRNGHRTNGYHPNGHRLNGHRPNGHRGHGHYVTTFLWAMSWSDYLREAQSRPQSADQPITKKGARPCESGRSADHERADKPASPERRAAIILERRSKGSQSQSRAAIPAVRSE